MLETLRPTPSGLASALLRIPFAVPLAAALLCSAAACSSSADTPAGETAAGDREYADAMAREHAGDAPVASGAAAGGGAGVVTEEVVYATVEDTPVRGWLARPAQAEGAPGLIVIHEWWGLNDNIRAMAEKLAGEGYQALAVDLYGGKAAESPDGARALVESVQADPTAAEENLRQAYAYLEGRGAPRIGSIGWCFGGGWSLRTALLLPDQLDAAVIYYGRLVTDKDQLAPLQVPILGLFGAEDRGIPVEQVRQFEAALRELGKSVEIHIYEGAGHAFANPSGTRYQPEAAEKAWAETRDFLAEHLGG